VATSQPGASAIVVGVGARAGIGAALGRRFARGGLHVFLSGRTAKRIDECAGEIRDAGGAATAVPGDTTSEADVTALFDRAAAEGPPLELVAYNAGNNRIGRFAEMDAAFFEEAWRVCCLGGFLVGREAARRMAPRGRGSVLFTGATASLRARPPFVAFASAKAGLRAIAQSMAREFGPQGLHVAHFVIDGGVNGDQLNRRFPDLSRQKGPDGLLDPDAVAETFWNVHQQQRSAWTHEVDLRPFNEPF
jgi:NAD(P)-dependent dehydrogenase (short-subunit alcohol dehydrogenase family)